MKFGPVELVYDDEVLEPRPWTVEQSRWAVSLLGLLPNGAVLELCSGAGQIGLVVGLETGRPLVQIDADERACAFARRNASAAGVSSEVRRGQLQTAVGSHERFALVLADPPYVPSHETHGHPDDPTHAIDGGDDGLDLARACLVVASRHLATGGLVLVQLGGPAQAVALSTEAPTYLLTPVEARTFGPDRSLLLLALSD